MSISFIEGNSFSKVVTADYFPLYVLFTEEEPDLLRHYDIAKRPTDCIEFACDYDTNRLLRLNLVLANSFTIVGGHLDLDDYPRGSLYLELPKITETSVFHTKIYDDGIEVIVSEHEPVSFCGVGNVRIGLDADGNVASVSALAMSPVAIAHAKDEVESLIDEEC